MFLNIPSSDNFQANSQWYVKDIERSMIDKRPAVYRWWFDVIPLPKEVLERGIVKKNEILSVEADGKVFYALYVGKAKSAYKRLYCHLPNEKRIGFRTSTLRRTLRALLCEANMTPLECARIVDDFMNQHAILEWRYCDSDEEAKDFESECIKHGYYPLNNSENDNLPKWTTQLTQLRNKWKQGVSPKIP